MIDSKRGSESGVYIPNLVGEGRGRKDVSFLMYLSEDTWTPFGEQMGGRIWVNCLDVCRDVVSAPRLPEEGVAPGRGLMTLEALLLGR